MNEIKSKKIGIDARMYGLHARGIGRFTKEIVDGIIKKDKVNKYVVFLGEDSRKEFVQKDNIEMVFLKSRWYSLREQFEFPGKIKKSRVDMIFFPHFTVPVNCPKPYIVTIHDLIINRFPEQRRRATTLNPLLFKIKLAGYNYIISRAIKNAEKIIAVSEFTKKDIIKDYDIDSKKIRVVYEGVADGLIVPRKQDKDFVLNKYSIDKPFIMYVGSAYPHKNLEKLIKVFKERIKPQIDIDLFIIGKDDYFMSRLKQYAKDCKSVKFTGFVPDNELPVFYNNALAYVFPSLYEGFGLPPLEAMQNGCPVVSSNATCLKEVLSDSAHYFNSDDEKDMSNKILEIINDIELRDRLIEKGIMQVKKYNWDSSVDKVLEIFNSI